LRTLTLNLVSLQIETHKTRRLGDELSKHTSSLISDLIESQINVLDPESEGLESRTQKNECLVGYTVAKVQLVIASDLEHENVILVDGLLKIVEESIVGHCTSLLTLLPIKEH
jgi:hypothetical protein